MSRVAVLLAGAAIGGAIAASFFILRAPRRPGDSSAWRGRAHRAERQVESLRARIEALAGQLEATSKRLQEVSVQLESLRRPPAGAPAAAPPRQPEAGAGDTAAPPDVREAMSEEEWNALVSGTLEDEVRRRYGRELDPERLDRLVETLGRLRDASLGLQAERLDPDDPQSLRNHLARSLTVLQADRAFREELGVGVSEFLRELDPAQVEEIPPAGAAPPPGG